MNPRHCIKVDDFSKNELIDLFELTAELKHKYRTKEDFKPFRNHSMAMIFAKPSARTRVSFETGFSWMGGHAIYLAPQDIGLGKRESASDLAQLFSRYNDLIMARVYSHNDMLDFEKHANVPVINGLTDYNHPCQILTDMFTVWEAKKKNIDDLKIVYVGDGNNIVNSWIRLAAILPFEFTCVCPEGYEPDQDTINFSESKHLSKINISHNAAEGVMDADAIYTDVTHSAQIPGNFEETTSGNRQFIPGQIYSAVASGCDGIFMEVHDNVDHALSDASTQWPLDRLEPILASMLAFRETYLNHGKENG